VAPPSGQDVSVAIVGRAAAGVFDVGVVGRSAVGVAVGRAAVVDAAVGVAVGRAAVMDAAAVGMGSAVAGRAAVVDAVAVGMDAAGPGRATADAAAIDLDATAMGECASTRRIWISSEGRSRPEGSSAT